MALLCLINTSYAQESVNITELFTQNEFSETSDNDLLFICRAPVKDVSKKNDWEKGILIDNNNKAHQVNGHYDAKSDEMQILLQNEPRTVFPQKIKAIKVGKMIFVPSEFEGQESLTYGYFQVLSSNKIDLLKRFENDKGVISKSFFTRKKDEAAKPIKLNKKCLLNTLDDKRTSKYLKDRNLDIKKETDLIMLFDYYNGLK